MAAIEIIRGNASQASGVWLPGIFVPMRLVVIRGYRIPFGKHNGQELGRIPLRYFESIQNANWFGRRQHELLEADVVVLGLGREGTDVPREETFDSICAINLSWTDAQRLKDRWTATKAMIERWHVEAVASFLASVISYIKFPDGTEVSDLDGIEE